MTKSLAIILSLILLISVGVFSIVQVKKLNSTKTHLSKQLKAVHELENSLETQKEETILLTQQNTDLQYENQVLRDSIIQLQQIITRLRAKIQTQDKVIAELQSKLKYLQLEYENKKKDIAILSRKPQIDQNAIATIEAEKAKIKEQINTFQAQQNAANTTKMVTQNEIQDKLLSEERFRKIVDVVNNTRIKFQDIKIKMNPTGQPVTRLITNGKNWKHTSIEFFMNHNNQKVLLDEPFIVKIVDIDNQQEIPMIQPNPMVSKNGLEEKEGAPFYYDGNMVEIEYDNNQPKKGKNFEVQVYYQSDDGEEYLLLDGIQQFIRDGNIVQL